MKEQIVCILKKEVSDRKYLLKFVEENRFSDNDAKILDEIFQTIELDAADLIPGDFQNTIREKIFDSDLLIFAENPAKLFEEVRKTSFALATWKTQLIMNIEKFRVSLTSKFHQGV